MAPKKQGTGLIVAGAIILTLGLLGNLGRLATSSSSDSSSSRSESSESSPRSSSPRSSSPRSPSASADEGLEPGDCVIDIPDAGEPDSVDCSNPAAQLQLGAVSGPGQCPDGPASQGSYLYQATPTGQTRCFLPNFVQGDCFRVDSVETMFRKVDCADPNAAGKVTARLESNDPGACAPPAQALAFPEPERTYCLSQNE
jgi:hypothetical protein